jgi:Type II secretion system (T2SS), protein E, N-terminal domain/GAF domain
MANRSNLTGALRRSLLIKVISKPTPTREDVDSVIELTASKVVEALQARSMTLYLVDGGDITFKHVYYSPSLWGQDKEKEKFFKDTAQKLLTVKLPRGTGNVGKVIESGEPVFFSNKGPEAASLKGMNMGFEVSSMLTVPLKSTIVIGAIQVLNKEPAAGTGGQFTPKDLAILQEVAEYSSSLIQRMLDPKFQPSAEDTARFISKFTDLPLVTELAEGEIDDKLVEVTGDAIIRREGVFPVKKVGNNGVSVVMVNPLDYAKRESFQQATELHIEEVRIISASLLEGLLAKFFKEKKAGAKTADVADVDID